MIKQEEQNNCCCYYLSMITLNAVNFKYHNLKFNTLRHHSRILSNMQCMNTTLVERKKTLVVKGNLNVSYLF